MQVYVSHKKVAAKPMTLGDYNDLQGWDMPKDQDRTTEGYLVEYLDGGEPNHVDFKGYISWSPKRQFDEGYTKFVPEHQQRVIKEKAELDDKRGKLAEFMDGENFHVYCDEPERNRMIKQFNSMTEYSEVLTDRIVAF